MEGREQWPPLFCCWLPPGPVDSLIYLSIIHLSSSYLSIIHLSVYLSSIYLSVYPIYHLSIYRDSESGRGEEREGERIPILHSVSEEPHMGLEFINRDIMT